MVVAGGMGELAGLGDYLAGVARVVREHHGEVRGRFLARGQSG